MIATDKATEYLKQLAPHVRDREAESVIRDLIAENDRQRDMIIRAINGAIRRHRIDVGLYHPTWCLEFLSEGEG